MGMADGSPHPIRKGARRLGLQIRAITARLLPIRGHLASRRCRMGACLVVDPAPHLQFRYQIWRPGVAAAYRLLSLRYLYAGEALTAAPIHVWSSRELSELDSSGDRPQA
jgi:hypothetical protein